MLHFVSCRSVVSSISGKICAEIGARFSSFRLVSLVSLYILIVSVVSLVLPDSPLELRRLNVTDNIRWKLTGKISNIVEVFSI